MKIIGIILARGGSKGIPNKNVQEIGGIPLVGHIIDKACRLRDRFEIDVVLSTDSEVIRDIGVDFGATVNGLRPSELAADNIESLPVVQYELEKAEQIKGEEYDVVAYMQPTTPLCRVEDLARCLEVLSEKKYLDSSVTVTRVGTHPFKMKRLLPSGEVVNYIDQGFEDMRPRQQLPEVYRRAGSIYASRREVIIGGSLVGNRCEGVPVPIETAIDIDSWEDLELVRILYNRLKQERRPR